LSTFWLFIYPIIFDDFYFLNFILQLKRNFIFLSESNLYAKTLFT
jgi:hypothetical protein